MLDTIRQRIADYIAPELAERRAVLERAANSDHLTGLANRRAFDLALPGAQCDPTVKVMIFDADNFGQVNKRCGHLAGDQLLRTLAGVIADQAERYNLATRCFRLGGDEFAVLAPAVHVDRLRSDIEAASVYELDNDLIVSLTGTYADTYAAADQLLQARKDARKRIEAKR